jgi:hypothetical protein
MRLTGARGVLFFQKIPDWLLSVIGESLTVANGLSY